MVARLLHPQSSVASIFSEMVRNFFSVSNRAYITFK